MDVPAAHKATELLNALNGQAKTNTKKRKTKPEQERPKDIEGKEQNKQQKRDTREQKQAANQKARFDRKRAQLEKQKVKDERCADTDTLLIARIPSQDRPRFDKACSDPSKRKAALNSWRKFWFELDALALDVKTKAAIAAATSRNDITHLKKRWMKETHYEDIARKKSRKSSATKRKEAPLSGISITERTDKARIAEVPFQLYGNQECTLPQCVEELIKPGTSINRGDLRVVRMRLDPTTEERVCLQKFFGAHRFTYNRCVALHADPEESMRLFNIAQAPEQDVGKHVLHNSPAWVARVPHNQRQLACNEFIRNWKAALKIHKGDLSKTQLIFKSARESNQTIPLGARSLRLESDTVKLFSRACGLEIAFKKHKLWAQVQEVLQPNGEPLYDCKLLFQRAKRTYTLLVPVPTKLKIRPLRGDKIIALDPGVRTFLTGFDPNQTVLEIGKQDVTRLCRLAHHKDKFLSQLDQLQPKWTQKERHEYDHGDPRLAFVKKHWRQRRKIRSLLLRLQQRIENLVTDLHWKTANFLCSNYDVILLPKLEVSRLVRKDERGQRRKISKSTVRRMLLLSHYKFRQRLLCKAKQHGVLVLFVNEAYTSKTCTRCGILNHTLGSQKVFRCADCGLQMDRDIAGARNIFLRNSY